MVRESYVVSAGGSWGMLIGSPSGERGDVGLLGLYEVSESEAVGSSDSYDVGKDDIFRLFSGLYFVR